MLCLHCLKSLGEPERKMFLFDLPTVIAHVSQVMTLEPGDLIYTGTPGKPAELKDGDIVEVEIEGIGILRNPVENEV